MGYINSLLNLPAGRDLLALPADQRKPLERVMRDLRDQANTEAENAWKRRKGPMAAYWLAVATYARHTAHALSQSAICGKVHSGPTRTMPAGHQCPDCGLSLHDVPEGA